MATVVRQILEMDAVADRDSTAMKPRILLLIDEIGGIAEGGTERQVLQLIQLARHLGYEPRLAVLRGTEWLREEQAGCPIYFTNFRSLFRPTGWLACMNLVRWMRREKIKLVQTFFIESNVLGPWLARLAGVPVVIGSRRNMDQWQGRTAWIGPVFRRMQCLSNLFVDSIIANSRVVAQSMISGERIPPHKIRIAYNGIHLENFVGLQWQRVSTRKMLGINDDQVLVGNISCLRMVKGIHQFVDAARIVSEKDPHMRFLIVGDGSERCGIQERIRRYGLEDRIHLAGAQTNVLPYLAAMDIGVLSSLSEGFSNSLLEYMASGLPVVATDVGGNGEALNETGILVPPDDPKSLAEAILRLRSTDLRQQLGHAARLRVEQFSLERAEKRMEEIYGEMLGKIEKLQQKKLKE